MSSAFRYWLALHPDIRRPVGGVKQMHRLAEAISASGRFSCIIQQDKDFHPSWFRSSVKTISLKDWCNTVLPSVDVTREILVLPETYLPQFSSYAPGLKRIIFNQNGSYTFGFSTASPKLTPAEVVSSYKHDDLLHVWVVSSHDKALLSSGMGLGDDFVTVIPNCIDPSMFSPDEVKGKYISFMPRKNSNDSSIVIQLLSCQPWFSDWKLLPISNLPQTEVASILKKSFFFLSFGHPEGFGLPVAEAMSSGCSVVGYSGLGGRELFSTSNCPSYVTSVNVEYGDWNGFVIGLKKLIELLSSDPAGYLSALKKHSKLISSCYSFERMIAVVSGSLDRIESAMN